MAVSKPDVLFRCCFSSSAGRLNSGKYSPRASEYPLRKKDLHLEFETHSRHWEATPTALVSTTTNFLRVIHLAFSKLCGGDEADQIEIIFIIPDLESSLPLHRAGDLARQLKWSKEQIRNYQYEYLFEWKVPESLVIHRITMSALLFRGFDLQRLCGHATLTDFPKMIEFRTLICHHWEDLGLFERGHKAGLAACSFGLHSLTGRLADDILSLTFCRNPFGLVEEGIEDALNFYASSISDGLMNHECELEDLSETAAFLDYEYAAEVREMMWDFGDEPGAIGDALISLEEQYRNHRAALEKRVTDIYLYIGY